MAGTKNLVIVESPAKAKTLKKFLGSTYKIEASMGHVRDLPKSELGIDIENDFEPKYITIRGKGELLAKLRKEVKNADKVYLATDPDREGEAISWHLLHALKLDETKAKRITFNEITKNAVKKSIKEARMIDIDLVDAQQARRALDRIVGYKISPLLWKKVKKGLSAGRVQSLALRMICEREDEIENFVPDEYWTITAEFKKFKAKFHGTPEAKQELKSKEEVDKVLKAIKNKEFVIQDVKKSSRVKNPSAPFTTSTLQQEASKILGFTAQKTMSVAQQLYEGVEIKGEGTVGLVSYIRTDSTRIADEAYEDLSQYITSQLGTQYLNPERQEYKTKRRTQDAHEAIRPTLSERTPEVIKESISKDQFKLYKLIWERFVASQMAPALYDTVAMKIVSGGYLFRASGSVLKFDGYLAIYKKNEEADEEKAMPEATVGETLTPVKIVDEQHFTQPPARYSEAMLVKTLEEIGVGRPSTYAPTIGTLTHRNYITKENKVFYSTELGEVVDGIIKNNFKDIVNIDFTAKMEEDLDKVEEGTTEWKEVIRRFYYPFAEMIQEAEEKIAHIEIKDEETDIICENCGRNMVVKYGKFGKFFACPGFPECRNTKPFFEDAGVECPMCGGKILIKKTKKGRKYYGCDHNPECELMTWNLPTGEKCPDCGGVLVEKGTKNARVCCNNPECNFTKPIEERQEKE